MSAILQTIRDLLTQAGIPFREVHHEPTLTSEDSARARGEEMRIGGKALLMLADDVPAVFVLPANRKANSAAIRKELSVKRLRFATREELLEWTGLVPGSLPPFGKPIVPFTLYVDAGIPENDRIAFNAGSLTDSIIMSVADYLRIAVPTKIFAFSTDVSA